MSGLNKKNNKGMTLVEVVVVLSIFTVLSLAVSNSIAAFYKMNAYTISQSYQVSNARRGVDTLVRDVREMTYADDGSFPVSVMEDHKIGFFSDIDRDDSVEYVEYELMSTTTLQKRVYDAIGSPPVYDTSTADEVFTLSEYVQNLNQGTATFKYYDDSGNSVLNVTDVRYVTVQTIINIDPIRDPGEFMLRSSAAPRNLKDNL